MTQAQRIAQAQADTRQAAAQNQCPRCGLPVRRNLALTGWIQCSQYGAPSFRTDPLSPSCPWQGFTR